MIYPCPSPVCQDPAAERAGAGAKAMPNISETFKSVRKWSLLGSAGEISREAALQEMIDLLAGGDEDDEDYMVRFH
jgi:hypothetical protein